MFRKISSFLIIFVLLFSNFSFLKVNAVETSWTSSPWTYEKASHLAKKSLFWVNIVDIKNLYNAWNAEAAVNLLFPSVDWPSRDEYNTKMNWYATADWFNPSSASSMYRYYLYKKWYDPYQAKVKLFSVFEDIFSVFRSSSDDITYLDIENTHDQLYSHTLWNYKEMIKRNLLNNWTPWDYSLWKFLDLLNQTNSKYPNENYWRELLQLFLMLEYIPTESEDRWDTRNYTEDDVNSISKILVWFESDENTHEVTYNNTVNTNTKISLLDWDLKVWDSFPFYDEITWEIDVQLLKTPIAWNNGLPDNTMDYVFSKREYAISMFLADRLYRFYVAENPTKNELESISAKIIENNFEIFPVVKWLFASDLFYSDKSMNGIIYKTPLDLVIWTSKTFWIELENISYTALDRLWWKPYYPPNIFWRDWFDNNSAFYTSYTQIQWASEATRMLRYVDSQDFTWDKINLTSFIWEDSFFTNYKFYENKEFLSLKSWTWNILTWNINLNNFNLKDSNNVDLVFWTWTVNFDDIYINLNWDEKITIWEWKLLYDEYKIQIINWTHIKNWVETQLSWEISIDWPYDLYEEFTVDTIIWHLEDLLYNSRRISPELKNKFKDFLTHDMNGVEIDFDYSDSNYRTFYINGLIHLMLIQPEFVLQSWIDKPFENVNINLNNKLINNDSKLVIIKTWWGFDFLSWVIPKNEFEEYKEYRWTWAFLWDEIMDLDNDYYLNSSLAPFKGLYNSWSLKIINRVWTPDHSRWHDSASKKMTSLNNIYDVDADWIIGHYIKDEDPVKTVVLWGYKPLIFRWGNYLNIWSNAYFYITDYTNTAFRSYKVDVIKDILNTRTYPWDIDWVFKNSVSINNVSIQSKLAWWAYWAWYNMVDNFTFLEWILESNISNIVRMKADGWYDTHKNQKTTLKNNLTKVAERTTNFFNSVKDTQDITIVIYSEFWRTNKINSSDWTDHWKWGWMFILSNNTNLKADLNKSVYWNMSFKDSKWNWLWVWIDYRSVYSTILKSLYWKDLTSWVNNDTYNINDYVDIEWPKVEFLRKEYELYSYSSKTSKVWFKFNLNDTNFKPKEASYVKIEYGTDKDDMFEESLYSINRYMDVKDDSVSLYFKGIDSKQKYFYKITLFDNQYNKTILEWSFLSPEVDNSSRKFSINSDSRLSQFSNKIVNNNLSLQSDTSSWILLWSSTWAVDIVWENEIRLLTSSGTYVDELVSTSTWAVWNGWFILPREVNKDYFLWGDVEYNNLKISNYNLGKLIKVWADTLWVWMKLNKKVTLEIPIPDINKKYAILSSEDWVVWKRENQGDIIKNWNNIEFQVDHFTYFGLFEIWDDDELIDNVPDPDPDTWWTVEETTKSSSWGGGWSSRKSTKRKKRDVCELWDFSASYYDEDCWVDPDSELSMQWVEKSETYRLEDKSEEQRKETFIKTEWEKLEIQSNKNDDLEIFKDSISYVKVWKYKVVNIKWSKYNNSFIKVSKNILKKNFSTSNNDILISKLNNILLYYSAFKLKNIDDKTRALYKKKLIENANEFTSTYKKAKLLVELKKSNSTNNILEDNKKSTIDSGKNNTDSKKVEVWNKYLSQAYMFSVKSPKVYLKWDAYWKTDAWILLKWDIVEQVTAIHPKWFFKIKVIKAQNIKAWTFWYIFKRHLTK